MHVTFDSLKTFYNILVQKLKNYRGNWNQNDPAADDYIKNRPFYSKVENVILVDNLTYSAYDNGERPGCTFVIGQAYNITWNGTLYENIVCALEGGWRTLTSDAFYIDDDGGNNLYVNANDDTEWTLSISTVQEVVKKLDKKFIDVPDNVVTSEDLQELNNSINEMYSNMESTYNSITNHTTNKNNPHNVTAAQIDAAHIKHTHPYLQYLDIDTVLPDLPESGSWYSMAYGNGIFVAILYGGGAAYSKDGITWTEVTTPVVQDRALSSIAYGNGKFVAVAEYATSNIIIYSTDGIIWNTTEISTKANWDIIKYGNGKFVATARESDKLIYSEDGINWTEVTLSSSGWWIDIAYGNGKFIIIDMFLSKTAISEDGITWNVHTTSCGSLDTHYAGPLVYYNGKFISLRKGGNLPKYGFQSEDGITWTQVDMPKYSYWSAITYGNGKLVAISSNQGSSGSEYGMDAAYSEDGLNWHITTLPSKQDWSSVVYGNGKFVAISVSGAVAYSIDGITWFNHYTGIKQDGVSIDLATEEYVNNAIVQSDWNQNDETAVDFIKNKPDILTSDVLSGKMDAEDPVGSGTFSMGRMGGTTIGAASFTHGGGAEASGFHSYAKGLYPVAKGEYSHAEGYRVEATGDYSYAFGDEAIASGKYAYSFGEDTEASSNYSHAEGYCSIATTDKNESVTIAAYGLYGQNEHCAHAEGYGTVACGIGSHTEGLSTKASGEGAHAEGRQTVSSGTSSHAEGYNTTSSGIGSHSEGQRTSASGGNSHAEGLYTTASGTNSHAEGYYTTASGTNSHAEGEYSEAAGENQHVEGKYNALDENNQFVHIIGNGTYSTRSNAHTVDWNGNAWYSGDVYVGSTSGTNKDEGSKKLATEEYVDTSIANLSDFSPDEILNTLNELNAAIANKITVPQNAVAGDLLTYDGTNWVRISRADLIAEIIAALPNAEEASF